MSPLPTPKGPQTKVVFLASDRHNVVLGTAGTGKSTMAMLRALHLARSFTTNNGPVLVVTFNNTLVTHLRYLSSGEPESESVTVVNYHTFARRYLHAVDLMSDDGIVETDNHVKLFIRRAVSAVKDAVGPHPVLTLDIDWFADEIHWISHMHITSESDYQAKKRIGRQTSLQTGLPRSIVWAVRDRYHKLRAAEGYKYDWHDLGGAVIEALKNDKRPRDYRHIIIDEGQDLWPADIRSLADAVQPGGSLTFFGDYHQAIFGHGLSWRSAGIQLDGRQVEKFQHNLRNTAQIARVAIALAASPYMKPDDIEDLVEPVQPTADGPMPTLVKCRSTEVEIAMVKGLAGDLMKDQKVAILARTWRLAEWAAAGLPFTRLRKNMQTWDDEPGLFIGTYHSAKGLEFEAVFLPFLNDAVLPFPLVLRANSEEEAYTREARLLYVSVTRARSSLVMSYTGTLTSLLPPNNNLWVEESR